MTGRHSFVQKVWWWVVTLFLLTRDIDTVIVRLQGRQACIKGACDLSEVTKKPQG